MSILHDLPTLPLTPADYHEAVSAFKRRLIEITLHEVRGNRTHAARALGLQRTYLLRLIRDLNVTAPPPPERRRRSGEEPRDASVAPSGPIVPPP
jgi:DNA-binding NtrC family response regulator